MRGEYGERSTKLRDQPSPLEADLVKSTHVTRRTVLECLLGVASVQGMSTVLRAADLPVRVEIGEATIDVSFDSDQFDLDRTALLDWVMQSARAVTAYFGRFPVTHARVRILLSQRGRISNGMSFGEPAARCRISVGQHATMVDLNDDWELTHEMVHFGFPSVEERHRWIEEGIATYVEPIARAQVGRLTAEQVWGGMVRGMPQGLPQAGDRGLDNTHTWGRTYWGGAIFCLLADIEIRKRTGNAKGLQDALRAINRVGGTIESDWPLERAIEVGDHATHGETLMELYKQMASKPVAVDLPDLWKQLGVVRGDHRVTFENRAALASIRASIVV
jgi:hypothetical protein